MNENLDLTKILEGCPEGTEFYHIGYGRVNLVNIYLDSYYPIRLAVRNEPCANMALTKKGTMNLRYEGECVLFPSKDQRDWSKFERFWDKPEMQKPTNNRLSDGVYLIDTKGNAVRYDGEDTETTNDTAYIGIVQGGRKNYGL